MIEFYPQIKWVHVCAVLCSGALFLLRGTMVQMGHRTFALSAPLNYLSYAIDTVLLTAALMLLTLLPSGMFANGWLAAKLLLLVAYVVLGSLALRRAASPRRRAVCFGFALMVFAFMISVARAHHPLGGFARWFA